MRLTICLLSVLTCAAALAQRPLPQPASGAGPRLVVVDVQVVEQATGRVVTDLLRSDFEVFDNQERQQLNSCVYEETPIEMVVLHYISGGPEIQGYTRLTDGARFALAQLREDDQAAVIRYSSKRKLLLDFTSDQRQISRALFHGGVARSGAEKQLFDAIVSAAELLRGRAAPEPRRRAILLLTDDKELRSRSSQDAVIDAALDAGATVNALVVITGEVQAHIGVVTPVPGVPPFPNVRFPAEPDWKLVAPIVDATGGEMVWQDQSSFRFQGLLERLRSRYLLAYFAPPAPPGAFRTISVKLGERATAQHPKMSIRVRRGYYSRP